MKSAQPLINELHAQYCARTGFELAMNFQRERVWGEWLRWVDPAFTVADLVLMISYLRVGIRKGERNEGALKFTNLIGMPDRFEEDLQLARQWKTGWRRTPRTGPTSTAQAAPAPEMTDEEREEMVREFAAKKRTPYQPPS